MTNCLHQYGVSRRALAGGLLLLTHLLTGTGLLPVLVAALAWGDGQHRVSLQTKPGRVAVVLAHCHCATPHPERCANHEHSGVAHWLTAFSDSRQAEVDHVLGFRTMTEVPSQRNQVVEPPPSLLLSTLCAAPISPPWPLGRTAVNCDVALLRSDPVRTALRSVSLLI